MNKLTAVVLSITMVFAFAMAASWAQEVKAPDTSQTKPVTDTSRDKAASPMNGQKMLNVVGTISLKTEKVNEQEMKVPYIKVKEAKSEDGQNQLAVIGKTLKIEGGAASSAAQMDGKEASMQGMVKNDTIMATTITPMETGKDGKEKEEAKNGQAGGEAKAGAGNGDHGGQMK